MLNRTDKVFLAVAFACGLAAAASSVLYLRARTPEPIPMGSVLVASRQLPPRHRLTNSDIAEIQIPLLAGKLPTGVYSKDEREMLVGQTLSHPVPPGLYFSEPLFADFQKFAISPGMCGVSIHPYSTQNLAPGQLVNIWVCVPRRREAPTSSDSADPVASTMDLVMGISGDTQEVEPRLVLSSVLIKSVDNRLQDDQTTMSGVLDDGPGGSRREVMIEITPDQVRRLYLESRDLRLRLQVVILGVPGSETEAAR